MAARSTSRRARSDEPEDEGRSRGRSRDDREPEEAPRGRRSFRGGDDGADEPRGRSRRSGRDEPEDEPRGRGRDRDDDRGNEPDEPRRGRRSGSRDDDREQPRERGTSSTVGKGWAGYEKVKQADSDYVNTWKVPEKAALIKIMDEEPFSTYAEHWLDEKKGKKSYVCLGDECPLCNSLGDSPRGFALFNIIDMSDPDVPKQEVLKAGKQVANTLKEYAKDSKTSPINRDDLYWSIILIKSDNRRGGAKTNISPVKARDVDEDWNIDPFTEDELVEFEKTLKEEKDVLFINSRTELKEIAEDYE